MCSNPPVEGVRAVTCRLDTIEFDLQAVTPDEVGGAQTQSRLVDQVRTIRQSVDAAGAPGTPRARRKFKRAGRQLQAFMKAVARGQKRGKIAPGIAETVLTSAGDVKARILPFQKP